MNCLLDSISYPRSVSTNLVEIQTERIHVQSVEEAGEALIKPGEAFVEFL